MLTRALLATSLAALFAVALAGCGGGASKESNRYIDQVNEAQDEFASTFDRLSAQISATSTAGQDVKTLQSFRGAVDRVVRRLRGVKPPDSVLALHRKLVASIASYGAELAKAQNAFASNDPHQLIAAETQLVSEVSSVSARINAAIVAINTKLHR